MRVGILGGGHQGCCVALALAERGIDVTVFDRNDELLSRAAVANEGKVHLGYMYANDPSLATARLMMQGALAFAPFFERHLGLAKHSMTTSHPAAYVVHRDSQRTPEQVSQYLSSVHAMVRGASGGKCKAYFGRELSGELRTWPAAERAAQFDPEVALAAFDTPEVAIDPVALARAVRQRIADEPRIEVRPRHEVLSVQDDRGLEVSLKTADGLSRERFTHVVNALWDGRFAIDEKLGLRPERSWMHRLKYGVSFRLAAGTKAPPSATFVSGPFGEVVSYGDGLMQAQPPANHICAATAGSGCMCRRPVSAGQATPTGPCANGAASSIYLSTARRSGVADLCRGPGRSCNALSQRRNLLRRGAIHGFHEPGDARRTIAVRTTGRAGPEVFEVHGSLRVSRSDPRYRIGVDFGTVVKRF